MPAFCVFMCVFVCVFMCVCMCMYVHVCEGQKLTVCIIRRSCSPMCPFKFLFNKFVVCVYIHIYACIYVHMFVELFGGIRKTVGVFTYGLPFYLSRHGLSWNLELTGNH